MGEQTGADLEAVDFVQIPIGPDRGEVHDLVEAGLQAGGLCVEEDEAQGMSPITACWSGGSASPPD